MGNASSFKKYILKNLWIIVIIFLFTSCNTSQQNFHLHPNSYIVDQLSNKKIIMLGDFQHLNALPYKSLISLLQEWLDKVRNGESKDYNIVLILEAGPQEVSILKQFISTGNWKPLLDFWLPYSTIEWLEFCADLRSVVDQINKINDHSYYSKIRFDIFGGEESNIFDHPEFLKYSKSEGSKYFVNIRDSITSQNIINYLNKNKDRKAIIFYGNLHLIKNYVNKNIAGVSPDSEAYGYCLAHYLKQEYGDESILSINQYRVSRQMIKNSPFADAKDSNIFVYSKDIPWRSIQPQNYDAFILRHEKRTSQHRLTNIFSINVIKADIDRIQFLEKYMPGYLAESYYNMVRKSLQIITGKNFSTVSEWQIWIKNNKYDGTARLNSKIFKNEIFDLYYRHPDDRQIKWELYYLGFEPRIVSSRLLPKSEWDMVWNDAQHRIKYLNEVGIYWVGTAEEKLQAKKILDKFIAKGKHREITRPQDYLKLYRKIFEKANY